MSLRFLQAVALGVALLSGCASQPTDRGEAPSNEAVMAVLGTVRALHHEASRRGA